MTRNPNYNKTLFQLWFYLLSVILLGCNAQYDNTLLTTKTINTNWTFNYMPNENVNLALVDPQYDDSKWQAIALPHTWSTFETTGELHPFIANPSERDDPYWFQGWGYYRKKFSLNNSVKGKKIFVEFDGVQKYSKVYLNGQLVGDHKGGFTSFYFDISEYVQWDEENTMVVIASNRKNDKMRIAPMNGGNWDIYGGIYRDVRLVIKDKLHIPFQGSYLHEGGVHITTPVVTTEKASVAIKTYVKNDYNKPVTCELVTTIIDPTGKELNSLKMKSSISSGQIHCFEQAVESMVNPMLWAPDNPNLYKVNTEIFYNGVSVDNIESPLGFRFYHWDYESNYLVVNGKKINIKGTNRHQEYPWLGDAIPKWMHLDDMLDIAQNLGHNFIRLTHYPNDKYLYNLTDSLGLITVEEVPNIKNIDFDEGIQRQNVIEMIRRDRNHPSIFFWSMGNETSDASDSKWAWEEDTTRIIHLRKGEEGGDFITHTHNNLEMEHILRVSMRGWFDTDDAPASINSSPDNGQHCSSETWEHQMARVDGGSIRGLLGNNAVSWLYADHGADREYLNCPLKHFNAKGLVDLYRQPKYIYHLTKSNYTNIPTIFIHPHYWRSNYAGSTQNIAIDSNCEEVSLFVDNKLLAKKRPSKAGFYTLTFENVAIEKGGTLKAQGIKGGKEYQSEVQMTSAPHRIVVTSSQSVLPADRSGITIIKADIIDKDGIPVFDASNTLRWEVDGPGKLVGPDIYESDIAKLESKTGTGYGVVPVCNLLRSTNIPGEVSVIVSSPGLISDTVHIKTVEPIIDNSLISEPALADKGRNKVARDNSKNYQPIIELEINPIRENHVIAGKDFSSYQVAINGFIQSRNRGFNKDAFGYPVLVDELARKMVSMQGELIADDYNFIVNQYNQYYELEKQINRGTGATEEDKEKVLRPLAKSIIEQSAPVDVEKEKLRIRNMHF